MPIEFAYSSGLILVSLLKAKSHNNFSCDPFVSNYALSRKINGIYRH